MRGDTKLQIYCLVSLLITIFVLLICKNKIKNNATKNRILKMISIITILIHYSSLWVDYLSEGSAKVDSTMLFLIYPCNICMWLLLITSYIKNTNSKFYKIISEFTAYAGVVCGTIGLVINENFLSNPSFLNYYSLKGLLSHSTMILGCLYLFVMGFVNISVLSNMYSVLCGLIFFLIDGAFINILFRLCKLDSVNAMYLEENPFPNLPFLNTITMGLMGMIVLFIFTSIYEILKLEKSKRWYYCIRKGK